MQLFLKLLEALKAIGRFVAHIRLHSGTKTGRHTNETNDNINNHSEKEETNNENSYENND